MSAGLQLSQLEGIIPAIETSHALAVFDHKKKAVTLRIEFSGPDNP